jgi:hypothetical protein
MELTRIFVTVCRQCKSVKKHRKQILEDMFPGTNAEPPPHKAY